MAKVGMGVGFWHPRTQFRLRATPRSTVSTVDGASHLASVVDVDLQASVVPDLDARQNLAFDVGLLEKLDVQFAFDDRGLLESLNAESGRDITPVVSLLGKVVGLATAVVGVAPLPDPPPPLEAQWDEAHPRLVELRTGLAARIDESLTALVREGATAAQTVELGAALAVLEGYQASIGRLRREWIAAQAVVGDEQEWRLRPVELYAVGGSAMELPDQLQAPVAPSAQEDAHAQGVLLAIADGQRPAQPTPASPSATDVVRLRGSRPVQAGIYLRGDDDLWALQRDSVLDLDVVDEYSTDNALSLDGSWRNARQFTIAFHPDKSLKTFGVASVPAASAVSAALGGVVDSVSGLATAWAARPSAQARELERVKTQLDLAQTTSELEVLAATRSRAAELAALEQEKQLRDAGA